MQNKMGYTSTGMNKKHSQTNTEGLRSFTYH